MEELKKQRYRNFIIVATVPVLLIYIMFMIVPIGQSFYYSLFEWSGFTKEMNPVGFQNYISLIGDDVFLQTVVNTVKYVFIGGALILGITSLFTYAINNFKSDSLKRLVQTILFVPNTIAPVALGIIWTFIFDPNWGLVPGSLQKIGLGALNIGWLSDDHIFWAALSLLVWIHVGYFIVIFLAGADRIPITLYESAELDGATSWQRFTRITMPLMRDVVEICLSLWIVFSFKIFGYLYVFGAAGGIGYTPVPIRNISIQLFLTGFGKRMPINKLGYACAMGVVLLLSVAFLVYLVRKLFGLIGSVEY